MQTIKNSKGIFFRLLFLCCFLLAGSAGKANAGEVDIKAIVSEHIQDAYEWHITYWGDRAIRIPLPVILKSETSGWNVFLSSRLDEGKSYNGFRIAAEGDYVGKIVEKDVMGKDVRPLDLSLTKTALAIVINCIILLTIVLSVARWYRKHPAEVPKGFVGAVEMLTVNILDDVIKPCVGKNYARFAPFLLTAFYFILVNNVMGIIPVFPAGANTTGNIAITLVLALCTFLAVNVFGTKEYWKEIFWPDVPVWLKLPVPIMSFIEVFGIFTKPFALMMRLFANIMAGHSVILGITGLIFISAAMGTAINVGMSAVSVVFNIFMNCIELLVAFIQAYVFTMLSAVFIGLAQAEPKEEKTYKF